MAPDALVASRMNLKPGGNQPIMHSTVYGPNNTLQSMIFLTHETDNPDLVGKPKGMRRILKERGLWREGLKKQCKKKKGEKGSEILDQCETGRDCCALRILENQPDFKGEVSMLQTLIESKGHECIFYPKFHCKLNFIEFYWAAVKRYTRENCNYSFKELEETIEKGLDSVPLKTIRRFAGRSKRWMDAYADGLSPEQIRFMEKVYRSHRREPQNICI